MLEVEERAVAYGVTDPTVANELLYNGVGVIGVLALVIGLIRHRPVNRVAWILQAMGLGSIVVGELIRWHQLAVGAETFPSLAEPAYLGGGLLLAASLVVRVRSMTVVRDAFAALDAALVTTAGGVLVWALIIEPLLHAPATSTAERAWSIAHPVVDLVLLAAVARLLFGLETRSASTALMGAGVLLFVTADVGFVLSQRLDAYAEGGLIDLSFLVAYALIGASAVDPSMASELMPATLTTKLRSTRVTVLLGAALVPPLTLVVQVLRGGDPGVTMLIGPAVATLAAFVFALMRMVALVRSVQTRTVKAGEDRFEALVEHSTDVISVVDAEGMISYVSPAFRTALGRQPESYVGSALRRLAHPDDAAGLTAHLFKAAARPRGATSRFETRLLATDGTAREFEVVAANLLDDGVVDGLALTMRDITDRKALAAELSHQAFHDNLTGLANRALFADRVDHALHRRRRDPACSVAVLFVDLDDFKAVNDGLGHDAGDALLRAVGRRIVGCLRAGDTTARLGGDEFAVLLEDDQAPGEAAEIATRILTALRVPVSVGERELSVVASIGVTIATGVSTTVGLLRDADIAMYEAKRGGKDRVCAFDPSMRELASDRLALQTDLSAAIEQGQLRLVYQPIVCLDTGLVRGAEALVRWSHPERGEVMPDTFIPIAEQTGLIVPIGELVLGEACHQAARTGSTVGVNVSGVQFSTPGFLDRVSATLAETGLPPDHLTIEITETALMADTDATARLLDRLREIGVRIAIDDFGTGYCSLAYLQRFAVDVVKIDRAFVAELDTDVVDGAAKGSRLARTIMQMAASLDVTTVVAEGIETEAQLARLRELGCRYGQGFLLSRPMEREEYEALLADHLLILLRLPEPAAGAPSASVVGACSPKPGSSS